VPGFDPIPGEVLALAMNMHVIGIIVECLKSVRHPQFIEMGIPFKPATQSRANRPGSPGQSGRGSERSDAGVFFIA